MVVRALDEGVGARTARVPGAVAGGSPGRHWVTLSLLLASYSLVYFHRTMTGVMEYEIEAVARRFGYDPALLVSLLSSAYFYAYALSQFAVGSLVDYFGVRRVAAAFLLSLALGTLLVVPEDPMVMVLGRAIVGSASAAAFLSYQRSLSLYLRPEEQARGTALALVVGNLTAAMATYPLRCALDAVGLKGTLVGLALAATALTAAVYVGSSDVRVRGSVRGYLAKTGSDLRRVVADGHSWGVSIGALATYGTGLSFQSSWGQMLLSRAFGLSKTEVGLYLLGLAMVFTASCSIAGHLSDKVFRRRKPFLTASSASMALSWLLLLASSATADVVLLKLSLAGLGLSLGPHVVISVMMREAHGPTRAATSVAFMNTILFLGTAVLNSVLPRLSYMEAVGVSAALSAAGGVAVQLLARETYSREGGLGAHAAAGSGARSTDPS